MGARERMLARRALAPAGQPLGLDFRQQDSPLTGNAKAGFKGMHQGQVQFAQDDRINLHRIFTFLGI
jgi:hypothetical protein